MRAANSILSSPKKQLMHPQPEIMNREMRDPIPTVLSKGSESMDKGGERTDLRLACLQLESSNRTPLTF
jgi:hypothetical protein